MYLIYRHPVDEHESVYLIYDVTEGVDVEDLKKRCREEPSLFKPVFIPPPQFLKILEEEKVISFQMSVQIRDVLTTHIMSDAAKNEREALNRFLHQEHLMIYPGGDSLE
jgi:hypothetical protein